MRRGLSATLNEVLEVRGCPFEENQLWALLRSLLNILDKVQGEILSWDATHILLFPSGSIKLLKSNSSLDLSTTNKNQINAVALIILHCAAYKLNEGTPLNISPMLQALLTGMCEQDALYTIKHIQDICAHQQNAQLSDDKVLISEMCCTILGNISKTCNVNVDECSPTVDNSGSTQADEPFSCAASSISSSRSRMSSMFGKTYDTSVPFSLGETSFCKKQESNHFLESRNEKCQENAFLNPVPVSPITVQNIFKSVLKTKEEVPTIYIDSHTSSNKPVEIQICYFNYSKVKLITRNPEHISMISLLQSSLTVFLNSESTISESILKYFAFGTWRGSDFYFFDNNVTLDKVLKEFSAPTPVFYVRILFFPPDITTLDTLLLSAMYEQIRADVIYERIVCSHDEVLAFTALSLQCELGDYKLEYGCNYFVTEEFLPPRVVSKLGVAYLRSEVPTMHKQLTGIGRHEAKLLFLKKNQSLNDYGMEFSKVYRLKSCKDEQSTWIGAGPKGIYNFDIRDGTSRIKRHSFQWKDLKKVSFKGRKIVLSKLNPEFKLKFYLKDTSRAKYLVALIGKLHRFHSSHVLSRDLSALALFEDMMRITTSPLRHSTPETASTTTQRRSWTYNVPRFRRHDKQIRRASNSVASSFSMQSRDTARPDEEHAYEGAAAQFVSPSESSSDVAARESVVRELKSALQENHRADDSTSTFFFSDVEDEQVTDVAEVGLEDEKERHHHHAFPRPSSFQNPTSSASSKQNTGTDIHAMARDFYRSSLPYYSHPPPPAEESMSDAWESSPRDSDQ